MAYRATTSQGRVTEATAGGPGSRHRWSGHWGAVLAWTLTGSWGIWAIVRLSGADRLTGITVPVILLLSFTPYVAATAPIPIICAVLLRRWWAASVAGIVAASLLVAVAPRAIGSDRPGAKGPPLRVLSANLQYGQADPAVVVELVRRTDTEVFSVQELTPSAVKALERAGLTRLLPYHVLDAHCGSTGMGIYARHPLRVLPPVPEAAEATLQAELTLPDDLRVEVTAVHPLPPLGVAAFEDWRRALTALPSAADDGPVRVLAGDFNATLDHAHFRSILDRGYADAADRVGKGLIPTWGMDQRKPSLTIDHILVSDHVTVQRVEVYSIPNSDHRAVFADVRRS